MAKAAYRALSAQAVQASAPAASVAAAASVVALPASVASAPAVAPAVAAAVDGLILLPLVDLVADREVNGRENIDPDVVSDYRAIMLAAGGWGPFPAAQAVWDGEQFWLWRGFHRRAAYLAAAALIDQASAWPASVPVIVQPGSRRDALLLAAADNADHGLRRSVADKRRVVDRLLADPEWGAWSDSAIARRCSVSVPFVGDRRALLAGPAAAPAERVYTDRYGSERTMKVGGIAASNKARAGSAGGGGGGGGGGGRGAVTGKCGVCGRGLSDPVHVAAGCGPVCAAKRAAGGGGSDPGGDSGGDDSDQQADLTVNVYGDQDIDPADPGLLVNVFGGGGSGGLGGSLGAGLRSRLSGLVNDLPDYIHLTGDTAGAANLQRALSAALARLAGS